jgi:hypothetical protein
MESILLELLTVMMCCGVWRKRLQKAAAKIFLINRIHIGPEIVW